MSDQDAFKDIADAVHRLRRAFVKHGMKPPASIELGDYEDSYRFRAMMPSNLVVSQPQLRGNDPEHVANIMGMEIVMPARWRADRRGGRALV